MINGAKTLVMLNIYVKNIMGNLEKQYSGYPAALRSVVLKTDMKWQCQ